MTETSRSIQESWAQTDSLVALRKLSRLAEQLPGAVARRAGLSHNELRTLELLIDDQRGPAEIARVLGVSTAAASGIIDRLEERGHATRAAHTTDGRRTSVEITDGGRAEVVSYLMPMFRELARLDAEFDERDRLVIARYLDGAARAMRTIL
ncbi:MAG: MarR family transcriptional regulator [Propionibacteriales bacterium]|nr:MarR family transcriptional regulator [Propionibacteriales bacterium]